VKAIVFGCRGQLGTELTAVLGHRGYTVAGFDRTQVDVADPAQVEQAFAREKPGIAINAAAYNQVDRAEQEPAAAMAANGLAVRNCAIACAQHGARLLHFSTDYVFDGAAARPYTESDPTHPLSAYGVSKLAGEIYAQAYLDNALIIRTCGVFGPAGQITARGNFFEMMLKKAAAGETISGVADRIASPTYAPLLAARSVDMLERGLSGMFHVGGGEPASWFDFAAMIVRAAGLNPPMKQITEADLKAAARRPRYSALSNAKMEASGVEKFPSLETAVKMYMEARGR
jgi:dTDP-4-dehydrorhamnose reductase